MPPSVRARGRRCGGVELGTFAESLNLRGQSQSLARGAAASAGAYPSATLLLLIVANLRVSLHRS
eukprot:8618104-Alexandrium_andersonii.AAC.1